jgi:hypothetical protein
MYVYVYIYIYMYIYMCIYIIYPGNTKFDKIESEYRRTNTIKNLRFYEENDEKGEESVFPASPIRRIKKNTRKVLFAEEFEERIVDENDKKYQYYQGKLLKSDDLEDLNTISNLNHHDPLGGIYMYLCVFMCIYTYCVLKMYVCMYIYMRIYMNIK